MKKINKKKVFLVIVIIIAVIFEIMAFRYSRAKKIIDITAEIVDNSGTLEIETISISAADSGSSGYYIVLPEEIKTKKVKTYIVTEKTINKISKESEDTNTIENTLTNDIINENIISENKNIIEENIIQENTISENIIEENIIEQPIVEESQEQPIVEEPQEQIVENIVEKIAGETLYLTEDEVQNKKIILKVEYNTTEKNGETLYNQLIQAQVDNNEDGINDNTIKIEGYMPLNAQVTASVVERENIETTLQDADMLTDKISLSVAYDIKILYNENEYEPTDFDENVKVTITGMQEIDVNSQKYKIIHIDDENTAKEVQGVESTNSVVSFTTNSFSTYAVLLENDISIMTTFSFDGAGASVWDGTVATGYRFGSGTITTPYLITNGAELAYFASQVNNGTTYQNTYFSLIADIDLNGNEWTPIGNYNNSFRGTFDGSGHVIANAHIELPNTRPNEITSYGFFGSLGGGTNYTVIKNLELDDISIVLNYTGSTGTSTSQKGYYIGIVTGTIFSNSKINNVIVNGGEILDLYSIQIRNNAMQVFAGGIAGFAVNSTSSTSDPGSGNRYIIENCYSNTDINLDMTLYNTTQCQGQYAAGGIIGGIRSQPVWPSNCLYTGNLNATNAFTGPIFGYLRNNTGYSSSNNNTRSQYYRTLWNGEDAGSVTMNSYYTAYRTNNSTFTTTVTSGTSTSRRSNTTTNVGYVQGVNKGRYTNNLNIMLSYFNNYVTNNSIEDYVSWNLDSDTNSFYFDPELSGRVVNNNSEYSIIVDDLANTGNYTYRWFINGTENTQITSNSTILVSTWTSSYDVEVLIGNGISYTMVNFEVPELEIHVEFNINNNNNSVTAYLAGTGMTDVNFNANDYTYQWYDADITRDYEAITGQTSLSLNNLTKGMEYRLIAINSNYSYMNAQGEFLYGDRNVIFVDYNYGNNSNSGSTSTTAVKTLAEAYSRYTNVTQREENIIVLMGDYTDDTSFIDTQTSTTYNKNVTITGKYKGVDYEPILAFEGASTYRYLNGNTTFQYITLDGSTYSYWGGSSPGQVYFYLQGYSLTMGEQVVMQDYSTANTNQGLITGNSPGFHVIAGWIRYNEAVLPRNNPKILIKSGTYGRIILGGSPGTNAVSNLQMTTSRNFTGTATMPFNIEVTIDIQTSTTPSIYAYDVNLLVGGPACGNTYANVIENIKSGVVGRVLGGSIGDTSNKPNNWDYPINTFLGTTQINISGGTVSEVYGGCLGRNMSALQGNSSLVCDSYFYGTIDINISGGHLTTSIYGAGAGGVTGYSENSTDLYSSYGFLYETSVTIDITGGTIDADIYGGGYGYTEYLTTATIPTDGGSLYGASNINILGSPVINGDIYAAGRGYNLSSKPNLAQMEGDTNINISGTPNITGNIYGAGMGITNLTNMAKLNGDSTVTIGANLTTNVYGGGNIAITNGDTNIIVGNGTHTGEIFGGGNVGIITGTANVEINSGNSSYVYGGGNAAQVPISNVEINGGITNEVYGGGKAAGVTTTSVTLNGGTVIDLYGGSNSSGNITNSTIKTNSGTATNIYGGNNAGGTTSNSSLEIDGGTIITAIYGGGKGNNAITTNTYINLKSSTTTIPAVYGGGEAAPVTNLARVDLNGANATNVFGGSNTNGAVPNTSINIYDGQLGSVYGGNNLGGSNSVSTVYIDGGTVTQVYGGGNQVTITTSNVDMDSGTVTNLYGGGNQAGATTTNVNINGGNLQNAYGGAKTSGTVTTSNVTLDIQGAQNQNGFQLHIYGGNNEGGITTTSYVNINAGIAYEVYGGNNQNGNTITSNVDINGGTVNFVYGGNNLGGTTTTSNVIIDGGTVTNVYGGGNQAVTNVTYVNINNDVSNCVYGGGNAAGVNTNTNLEILNAQIGGNVYGGGNEGIVTGNTYVHVKNSELLDSLYAGGNGSTAIVLGNTNVTMDGTTNEVTNSVFGSGNQAATGTQENNTSVSIVNIAGATIGANVYGGANTSFVYGTTYTNIGFSSITNNAGLQIGDIEIGGTVYGGGESISNSTSYEATESVTRGIEIYINGTGHAKCKILGSIFGSGNFSSSGGNSNIYIKDYGSVYSPQSNISIQRATTVTFDNSAMTLSGATDSTNDFGNVYYTLNRINEFKLKNNSIVYLNYGGNVLKNFTSAVDINGVETKAAATIDPDTGETIRNVDNRIYMAEGRNLNVSSNQAATLFEGEISGMTFFGIFTNTMNPSTSTGIYNQEYENGDQIINAGTFSLNSYVRGQHMEDHDITVDGFYSNYEEEENPGYIKSKYIEVTPEIGDYYIWLIGAELDVTLFEFSLQGAKYSTLGTYELGLAGFETANTKFVLYGFSAGLADGISLVEPSTIENISINPNIANEVFGLSMKTGNSGWMTNSHTNFLTANGGTYTGANIYNRDNAYGTPILDFCLYHSGNISSEQNLGSVRIRFQALVPVDALNYRLSYIDVIIDLTTLLIQDEHYEAAVSPGEKFELFTTTQTSITDSSVFSVYNSLYISRFSQSDYYDDYTDFHRVLVSRDSGNVPYAFTENTKITMIDMVTNKYYYYVVTALDESSGKYIYRLSDFVAMGSDNSYYNDLTACSQYYNTTQDLIYENFIFHIDFNESQVAQTMIENSLLIELRDQGQQTYISVWEGSRDTAKYDIYVGNDATINVNANLDNSILYRGKKALLTVTTTFNQVEVNSKVIYDTEYFDDKMGIKISIFDNNGNRLNSDTLLGVSFKLDGIMYYPRVDGTTRIKIADKVSNVLSRITMDTAENTILATGNYTIRVESFGSPDGIYYGTEPSDFVNIPITIINSTYGLKVYSDNQSKIINKTTGFTEHGNNSLWTTIEYSSGLNDPNIAVSLYRRNYSEIYQQTYTLVDLEDYVTTELTSTLRENEYVSSVNPAATSQKLLQFKENLTTGTYKLVYKLYDNNSYIGETYEYIIIK